MNIEQPSAAQQDLRDLLPPRRPAVSDPGPAPAAESPVGSEPARDATAPTRVRRGRPATKPVPQGAKRATTFSLSADLIAQITAWRVQHKQSVDAFVVVALSWADREGGLREAIGPTTAPEQVDTDLFGAYTPVFRRTPDAASAVRAPLNARLPDTILAGIDTLKDRCHASSRSHLLEVAASLYLEAHPPRKDDLP